MPRRMDFKFGNSPNPRLCKHVRRIQEQQYIFTASFSASIITFYLQKLDTLIKQKTTNMMFEVRTAHETRTYRYDEV